MLRVCVIGMGHIGNLHARIYQANPLVQLAGVCDTQEDRAKAAGERFGVPYFLDAEAMLESLAPDLCSITTGGYEYAGDHYVPAMQALGAGCHVLCEKPISNVVAHAEEMVRLAAEKSLYLGVDFNHRFTPAARLARQWMDEGRLGDLLFVNVALWIGKPGEFDSPYYHIKALNPHSIDLIQHFCGDIVAVQCFSLKAPGRNIWSTSSFNFKLKNGMVGHLTSSYDLARGHPMERCEVAGTKGRFIIDDMWREATLYPADNLVKAVYTDPTFGGYSNFDDTFRARIDKFVQQVHDRAPLEEIDGSGLDALKGQRVIEAAIQSLNSGQVVEIA